MNWITQNFLLIHLSLISVAFAVIAWLLIRHRLFHWNSSGFWAWGSLTLYLFLNPLFALLGGNLQLYRTALELSGGAERALWIVFVSLAGMAAFFIVYLRTRPARVMGVPSRERITPPMALVLALFLAIGVYSLVSSRALLLETGRQTVIVGGRFVGQVTGYENAGYMFVFTIIVFFLVSHKPLTRYVGWALAGVFILFALPSGMSRYVLVSMLLAVALADTLMRRARLPRWWFILGIVIFTVALQLRGHEQWQFTSAGSELAALAPETLENITTAIGSTEVSMLATWYTESYAVENYLGYSYGLPVLNYLLTGWIPGRLFPQKYFLIDYLKSQSQPLEKTIERQLFGAKSTLLGSFYMEGGLAGVILLAALTGFLMRRLDGWISADAPLLLRALGIAWLSVLWMVWGSSDTWGITNFGILAIPIIFLWVLIPKFRTLKRIS